MKQMKTAALLKSYYKKDCLEAGCDEAGRGCYAGPVFAAAVILPENFYHPLLNDSKQVKPAAREQLRHYIQANALAWAVASITVEEIDRLNILKASQKAMHLALGSLKPAPEHILVDGNYFIPFKKIAYQCIVRGDSQYAAVAAASILAKTHRDEYMRTLHKEFPNYGWDANKGYGTAAHRQAIAQYGLSKHHRRSFNIVPSQLELFA